MLYQNTERRTEGGPETVAINGRNRQAELAASLVEHLGADGAIYACQANSWDGVLDHVLLHETTLPANEGAQRH